ncbi:MAG: Asp-tRNA(Asn)/Glu-tRNA(Gln) amidotransferase GatCAB subunit A [Bryobacterales bacterium]|nr:Asp-tRNA(Asn)/Glu-tRNA(Gln) amidotransferase GatCAB subunit A [Bryobacterales bacterium]
MSARLPFRTISEAGVALRERRISAVELTRLSLAAAAAEQPRTNLFLAMMEEQALADAAACDATLAEGEPLSPLHGIPVAVKDVYCTKGTATTCGSRILANHIPDHDAAVVERLRAAGAVIIGKTHMQEFAYGITCNNPHFGPVRNSHDVTRIPGGSSGGSGVAVASGVVLMAMGSDTGGSIRIPASFCGTSGLKPTTGRVSRYGVLPLDFTLDHMGPLAPTPHDCALTLQVLAGYDPRDESSSRAPVDRYAPPLEPTLAGLRLGIPTSFYYDGLQPAVAQALDALQKKAAALGATLVPVDTGDIAAINAIGRVILLSEASAALEPYLHRRSEFGADVLALLDQGRLLPATDYVNAQRLRRLVMARFESVWEHADCLLIPSTPTTAPKIGQTSIDINGEQVDVRLATTRCMRGINVLGLPALAIPSGQDEAGLPTGAQLVGRRFDEKTILATGEALMA